MAFWAPSAPVAVGLTVGAEVVVAVTVGFTDVGLIGTVIVGVPPDAPANDPVTVVYPDLAAV